MSKVIIKSQGTIYGSEIDPGFETDDYHRAEAHVFLHSGHIESWLTRRAEESGRFTKPENVVGEVKRNMDLLLDFETLRRHGTPTDHFGMDGQLSGDGK